MKKQTLLPILLILCLLLIACGGSKSGSGAAVNHTQPPYTEGELSGGSGTAEDPYLIRSEEDLRLFAQRCSENAYSNDNPYLFSCWRMEADIVLGDAAWTPITGFSGVFDGNGHSIGNLHFDEPEQLTYEGMFARLYGCVKNLTVTDSTIEIHENKTGGAIVGSMTGGELINCRVTASVSLTGPYDVGGLAGSIEGAFVEGCSNAAAVVSTGDVGHAGGIAARLDAEVKNCVNTGAVSAGGDAGGIASVMGGHAENCRNEGAVSSNHSAGGICCSFGDNALNYEMDDTTVSLVRCVNTGAVSADRRDAGGICAKITEGAISDCSNEGAVSSAQGYCGGIFGSFLISPFAEPAKDLLITGCRNSGDVAGTDAWDCGGIGGDISISVTAVVIENCINTGRVSADGNAEIGGILGSAHGNPQEGISGSLRIAGCRNDGAVIGVKSKCGGILGQISSGATEESDVRLQAEFVGCSSTGELRGTAKSTGGVIGSVSWGVDYVIEDCSGVYAPTADDVKGTYPDIGDLYTEE
ncbi:MAG: hypothetical protein II872_05045 [Clostridia bacterium]|nr:hypothetical protein [Clostridia bacterium]